MSPSASPRWLPLPEADPPKTTSDEDLLRVARTGNALRLVASGIAPNVVGLERQKQALLLSLASTDDQHGTRGRVSTLLWGPSGVAKTQLVMAAAAEADAQVYGPRASVGGLTIDFRTGKIGVVGRVHESEFQVLALDELEKFEPETLEQLLMAMETGIISYAGGGGSGSIPAHVRVIAACNDKSRLSPELLDRFDHVLHVPYPTRDQARLIVQGITTTYQAPRPETETGLTKRYLRWARAYHPDFPKEERRIATEVFKILVTTEKRDEVRLRRYHAVLRNAHSLARIDHAPVTAERVMDAATLLYPDWNVDQLRGIRELLKLRRDRNPQTIEKRHDESRGRDGDF